MYEWHQTYIASSPAACPGELGEASPTTQLFPWRCNAARPHAFQTETAHCNADQILVLNPALEELPWLYSVSSHIYLFLHDWGVISTPTHSIAFQQSAVVQDHGAPSATAHYPVADDTAMLPAYSEKDKQRAVRKSELLPEVAHQDSYRQRHIASGELAVTPVDARWSCQVSVVRNVFPNACAEDPG